MTDETPTPANDEPPRLPPGLCQRCGANIDRDKITVVNDKPLHGPPAGRCGPVLTHWLYHVAFVLQLPGGGQQFEESEEALPLPLEAGNARIVLRRILASRAPSDPTLIGVKPEVKLLWWQLLAAA